MLSSVLRSKTAIAVNIEIMRAFVELRRVANSYAAIQLIAPPPQSKRPVGFRVREDDEEPKPQSTA